MSAETADPLTDLTAFQSNILYAVGRLDTPHGLGIKQYLEEFYDKELHHGRLYPNLDTLVEKGLIDKEQADRRTNQYTLTRRGARELQADRNWRMDGGSA